MTFALALALAAAEPSALHWSAPAGCPTQDEVAALLEQEAGAVPEDRRPDVDTAAVVTATERGTWKVAIAIRQDSGELRREFELDSCAAAAEAVALVYALALTEAIEAEPPPEPEPEPPLVPEASIDRTPEPPRPSTTPRVEPVVLPQPPPRRRPPRFTVHAGGGGGVGSLGRGGGHVLAGLGVAWRWIRLGVRVDHAIVRPIRRDDNMGANLSTTTGGVELSIPIATGPVELLPTIDLRAGGLRARGIGGIDPQVEWVPWVIAGAGMSLIWMPGDWWGVRVGAEVEVPLLRHTFAFDTLETAQTQRVGGLFWAGPEFRFPRRLGARSGDSRRPR